MTRPSLTHPMAGFTLLEIMVALAIFATLATAAQSAGQYVVKQTSSVEERLMAAWVADNHLNELRLQPDLEIGRSQQAVLMNRRDWLLRQHISASSSPRLLKVEIHISLSGREQTVHSAAGWIPNYHE